MSDIYAYIENSDDEWIIRVVDVVDNEYSICNTIEEFANAMAMYGTKHGSQMNVIWSKAEDVTPEQFNEIERGMRELQKIVAEEEIS